MAENYLWEQLWA